MGRILYTKVRSYPTEQEKRFSTSCNASVPCEAQHCQKNLIRYDPLAYGNPGLDKNWKGPSVRPFHSPFYFKILKSRLRAFITILKENSNYSIYA